MTIVLTFMFSFSKETCKSKIFPCPTFSFRGEMEKSRNKKTRKKFWKVVVCSRKFLVVIFSGKCLVVKFSRKFLVVNFLRKFLIENFSRNFLVKANKRQKTQTMFKHFFVQGLSNSMKQKNTVRKLTDCLTYAPWEQKHTDKKNV